VAFSFLWKFLTCHLLFPRFVPRDITIAIAVGGVVLRIVGATIVRTPSYLAALNADYSSNNWSGDIQILAHIINMLIQYGVDYVALPLIYRYFVNRSFREEEMEQARKKTRAALTLGKPRERKPMGEESWVGALTYLWIFFWFLASSIAFIWNYKVDNVLTASVFPRERLDYLTAALWAPLILIGIMMQKERYQGLNFLKSFGHLTFYLWLIEMIPMLTGTLLESFQHYDEGFIKVILYLILFREDLSFLFLHFPKSTFFFPLSF